MSDTVTVGTFTEDPALYWRCALCLEGWVQLRVPYHLGAYCCGNCGMTCLRPTYGPLVPEGDIDD